MSRKKGLPVLNCKFTCKVWQAAVQEPITINTIVSEPKNQNFKKNK